MNHKEDFSMWKWVPIIINTKDGTDFGDIPICRINLVTGNIEKVENPRGVAYGARNQMKYRKSRKELRANDDLKY